MQALSQRWVPGKSFGGLGLSHHHEKEILEQSQDTRIKNMTLDQRDWAPKVPGDHTMKNQKNTEKLGGCFPSRVRWAWSRDLHPSVTTMLWSQGGTEQLTLADLCNLQLNKSWSLPTSSCLQHLNQRRKNEPLFFYDKRAYQLSLLSASCC